MYVISFRIPFNVLGTTQYVNGSAASPIRRGKGDKITVMNGDCSGIQAEVIDARPTARNDFPWTIALYY